MVLFEKDWIESGAVIHYETTNKTALILAAKLRQMGVKNNSFFLALHDKSLANIDPFRMDLDEATYVRIAVEIKINPWYYFREIARAPAQAGNKPDQVRFNRANISLWWSFYNHATYILIQPRQTGKSFSTDHLMTQLMNFGTSNTKFNLLTLNDKLRAENIDRLKNIYSELPKYLNFKDRTDANNTEELTVNKFKNKYKTHVPQASEKGAYNLGRGLTTAILHVDEAPFQPNIKIALEACLPAMDAAVDKAERDGEPYGIIFTTTAGKKDSKEGKYFYEFMQGAAEWSELFYDCEDKVILEETVRKHSRGNKTTLGAGAFRIVGTFSHRQLGQSDEWLIKKLTEKPISPEAANRDYFNIWTSGTQSSPLSVHILEKLTKAIRSEDCTTISPIGSYITKWYIPKENITEFMATRKTVAGIDSSDGSGGDGISFVLIDVQTGATVATGLFNETNIIVFAKYLAWTLKEYPNMTMVIERRSTGSSIIDYLLDFLPQIGIDPFQRLFNWIANDPYEHKERAAEIKLPLHRRSEDIYVRCKKYFGFATSGGGETSRSDLYSTTLQNAAKRCSDRVLDKALTEQITGLVIKNGRVDHDIGMFDDLVIGWLLCHWLMTSGRNLAHYGIDPNTVLQLITEEKQLVGVDAYKELQQLKIRERINELFKLLSIEENEVICERHEKELRYLDSMIVLKDKEMFSVDAAIKRAQEENRRRFKQEFNNSDIHNRRISYIAQHDENIVYC